ncbi:MAG: YybH family protein [Nocardioides sp.]
MEANDTIELVHRGLEAFVNGEPRPMQALFSSADDVTLANPFGSAVRGREQVMETTERAASHYRDGRATGFDRVSQRESADMAYFVEFEHYVARIDDSDEVTPFALRVTMVLARERDAVWRIVHRHADSISAASA